MVAAAVLILPQWGGCLPLTSFGGLSLLKRAVLTAQKAGITHCFVYGQQATAPLLRELQGDRRVTSRVTWVCAPDKGIPGAMPSTSCLVFTVDTVFRHSLLQDLFGQSVPGKTVIVADDTRTPALALVPEGRLSGIFEELGRGRRLEETTALTDPDTTQRVTAGRHFLRRVADPPAVGRAERDLLRSLENPRDGLVDTHLNRKLSRPLSQRLLRTPLTPNQITLLAGACSLLGALCFTRGGYWGPVLGALFLQGSAVLDCCDGEVARVKLQESPLGDWLDVVCDTVGAIAIFLGIGVAVWRNGAGGDALVVASVLVLGGLLAFPLVTLAENTEEAGRRRGGWEDTVIQQALLSLTNRDYSVVILASAVAGKLGWFLWAAAAGAHIFWPSLAWLLYRDGRLGRLSRVWERHGA